MIVYNSLDEALKAENLSADQITFSPEDIYLAKGIDLGPHEQYDQGRVSLQKAMQLAVQSVETDATKRGVAFLVLHDSNLTHILNLTGTRIHGAKYMRDMSDETVTTSELIDGKRRVYHSDPTDSQGRPHFLDLNAVFIGYHRK